MHETTVAALKGQLSSAVACAAASQRLVFQGRELEDSDTVASSGITAQTCGQAAAQLCGRQGHADLAERPGLLMIWRPTGTVGVDEADVAAESMETEGPGSSVASTAPAQPAAQAAAHTTARMNEDEEPANGGGDVDSSSTPAWNGEPIPYKWERSKTVSTPKGKKQTKYWARGYCAMTRPTGGGDVGGEGCQGGGEL